MHTHDERLSAALKRMIDEQLNNGVPRLELTIRCGKLAATYEVRLLRVRQTERRKRDKTGLPRERAGE